MDGETEMTREGLVALINEALDAETRTTPPPAGEEGDWLYGSAGFTEPDEHGWMAPLPSAHVWVPRALMFWHMVVQVGPPEDEKWLHDPRHSLARWPMIEVAVDHHFRAGI